MVEEAGKKVHFETDKFEPALSKRAARRKKASQSDKQASQPGHQEAVRLQEQVSVPGGGRGSEEGGIPGAELISTLSEAANVLCTSEGLLAFDFGKMIALIDSERKALRASGRLD